MVVASKEGLQQVQQDLVQLRVASQGQSQIPLLDHIKRYQMSQWRFKVLQQALKFKIALSFVHEVQNYHIFPRLVQDELVRKQSP